MTSLLSKNNLLLIGSFLLLYSFINLESDLIPNTFIVSPLKVLLT